MALSRRAPLVLLGAAFLTFFDRALMPPMMTAIAEDWGVGIEQIGPALTGHVIAYGLSQLLWSIVSSRIGQLRLLRVSLVIAVVASVASALAVDPVSLAVARVVGGAAFGATVPATIVYLSDTMPLARRGVAMANLATALALGMTAGTAAASLIGPLGSWRWTFAGAAAMTVAALLLVWLLAPGPRPAEPLPIARAIPRILGDKWSVLVLVLAAAEGAVLIGTISFLPIALEFAGEQRTVAGVVTSIFGIAVIVSAQIVRLVIGRTPPWAAFLVGGGAAIAGYALLSVQISLPTVLAASAIFGFAWAAAHTQLQTWMSDAVSAARPVGTAFFGLAFFGGGAIGTALGTAFTAEGAFGGLFVVATVLSTVFTVGAVWGRIRYRVREQD